MKVRNPPASTARPMPRLEGVVLTLICLLAAACSDTDPPTDITTGIAPIGRRSLMDRPAEVTGPQIHVIYMVSKGGVDRGFDTTGTLERSVIRFQNWFGSLTAHKFREDQYQGRLDITFFRSSRTDAQIARFGRFILNALHAELEAAGFDDPDTKYLIYYDGSNPLTCGNALQEGSAAAVYLNGSYDGDSCRTPFVQDVGPPGYWDLAMLHEAMHTLGAVHFNAPNHNDGRRWHVDDGSDLMHGGSDVTWRPQFVDRDNDDYFGDSLPPWLRNLKNDPILVSGVTVSPPQPGGLLIAPHGFPPLVDDVIEPRKR